MGCTTQYREKKNPITVMIIIYLTITIIQSSLGLWDEKHTR